MNKQLLLLSISSIAAVMLLSGATQAAAAGFIQIPDIPGDSTTAGHENWITLDSVQFSISRDISASSGSPRHTSGATFGDLVLVKEIDSSTPKLMEAIAAGKSLGTTKIDFVETTSTDGERIPYLQWELENVRVSSYSMSGSTEDGQIPTESFSLNFEKIKVTYNKINDKGEVESVEFSWDLTANKKV